MEACTGFHSTELLVEADQPFWDTYPKLMKLIPRQSKDQPGPVSGNLFQLPACRLDGRRKTHIALHLYCHSSSNVPRTEVLFNQTCSKCWLEFLGNSCRPRLPESVHTASPRFRQLVPTTSFPIALHVLLPFFLNCSKNRGTF